MTTADAFGNLLLKPTARIRPRLIFTAHMDHPAFWALRTIGPNRLLAQWMGRIPTKAMPGQAVRFWTAGRKLKESQLPTPWLDSDPPLRLSGKPVDGRVRRVLDSNELGDPGLVEIDIKQPVQPGSIGMWKLSDPAIRRNQIHARAIDDVAAVAALLSTMRNLSKAGLSPPIAILLTRAEEGGFFGAIDHVKQIRNASQAPTYITLEMSMARPEVLVGSGVVIRLGDRQTTYDPPTANWLSKTASELADTDPRFTYQRQLMPGGTCESTVFQAALGRAGALCLPLGNYHNLTPSGSIGHEYISLADYRDLITLCTHLATQPRGSKDTSLETFHKRWRSFADRHQHLYHHPDAPASLP
ncbi:M20/M25/M40 family metallo-hydrolase [Mucisphaera sp.]|uniref:M20/M25/M40 family metallo-hydrolase n=1 Tax=Mucisphaera sp. TaxID=2913024 RepID=UPI003D0E3AB9